VSTRGQNRQEGELDEISEIVHREASAHTSRLIDREPLAQPSGTLAQDSLLYRRSLLAGRPGLLPALHPLRVRHSPLRAGGQRLECSPVRGHS
jgi:hypothetical protein